MPRHKITGDAVTTHTHDWADVTGEPVTYPPSAHTHDWAEVTGEPATYPPSAHNHSATEINSGLLDIERAPVDMALVVTKSGSWPARPTARADVKVFWMGPEPSPATVTSGTGGMRQDIDIRIITP